MHRCWAEWPAVPPGHQPAPLGRLPSARRCGALRDDHVQLLPAPGAAALSPGLGWSLLLLPASRRSTRVISTPQAPDLLLISCPV